MSDASRNVLESLTKNYMWIRTLTRPSRCQNKLGKAEDAYRAALSASATRTSASTDASSSSSQGRSESSTTAAGGVTIPSSASLVSPRTKELHGAVETLSGAAIQHAGYVAMENAKKAFA